MYRERGLDDPELAAARRAVNRVLAGHAPNPALAVDRHWTLLAANSAVQPLLLDIDPSLLEGNVNVLRLSLHPGRLAPRIGNLLQWRAHLFDRLRQQIAATDDPVLVDMLQELQAYPSREPGVDVELEGEFPGVVVPLQLRTASGVLQLFTTTVFGSPVDITLQELAVESFFPCDAFTANQPRLAAGP